MMTKLPYSERDLPYFQENSHYSKQHPIVLYWRQGIEQLGINMTIEEAEKLLKDLKNEIDEIKRITAIWTPEKQEKSKVKSTIVCDYCGDPIPHIFAGDEVNIKGEYYFCCMECVELVRKLESKKKEMTK